MFFATDFSTAEKQEAGGGRVKKDENFVSWARLRICDLQYLLLLDKQQPKTVPTGPKQYVCSS